MEIWVQIRKILEEEIENGIHTLQIFGIEPDEFEVELSEPVYAGIKVAIYREILKMIDNANN